MNDGVKDMLCSVFGDDHRKMRLTFEIIKKRMVGIDSEDRAQILIEIENLLRAILADLQDAGKMREK